MTSATTATHRFVETGGIRMHIAEQGSGPLVLLLHGFPECWYSWRYQLHALVSGERFAHRARLRGVHGRMGRREQVDLADLGASIL